MKPMMNRQSGREADEPLEQHLDQEGQGAQPEQDESIDGEDDEGRGDSPEHGGGRVEGKQQIDAMGEQKPGTNGDGNGDVGDRAEGGLRESAAVWAQPIQGEVEGEQGQDEPHRHGPGQGAGLEHGVALFVGR